MKQYNILGGVDIMTNLEQHPQFKEKIVNPDRYYGSDLNKLVASDCRKDMMVMNIDLIVYDYNQNIIKIIESKHLNEKLGKGQENLLKKLALIGIETYVIYASSPYIKSFIHNFKTNEKIEVNKIELIKFLNNY